VLEVVLYLVSAKPLEHPRALLGTPALRLSFKGKQEKRRLFTEVHSIQTYLALHEPE
jgi:hypothetical protein